MGGNWIILGAVVYTEAKGERTLKMSLEERMGQGRRKKWADQKRKNPQTGVLDNQEVHFRKQDLVKA